jgi:nitroreductase
MTLDQIIRARASIRAFDSRPLKKADILTICEAARLAPSACNSQTWRFVVVTDRALIRRICDEAMWPVVRNAWLKEAPCVIVGCSKLDMVANTLGRTVSGTDYYQIDLGIAMEHMALKAVDLGLGTCWIGWFSKKKIRALLGIPKRIRVLTLLALGRPKTRDKKEKDRKPLKDIVFLEKWGGLL